MPIYNYECDACSHAFEELQTMSAAKLTTCPSCGRESLVRLIGSGSGIIFKGSGFYETDYKNNTPSPADQNKSSCTHDSGSCGCAST